MKFKIRQGFSVAIGAAVHLGGELVELAESEIGGHLHKLEAPEVDAQPAAPAAPVVTTPAA